MLPLTTCEALAKLIDHPLVKPELTDEQVIEGLELAKRYHIACASFRPARSTWRSPSPSSSRARGAWRWRSPCRSRSARPAAPRRPRDRHGDRHLQAPLARVSARAD